MYDKKTVSVVLATYNEKSTIRKVIEDFFKTGVVDEMIVVNNNAEEGTDEEVKETKAKLFYEKRQGYGYTFKTGIKKANGDFIVLCEPDGSFVASEIKKFLKKTDDGYKVVFATRTAGKYLYEGEIIDILRSWANFFVGKTIQILFQTSKLSDIGTTYKLFDGKILKKYVLESTKDDPLFATELLLLTAIKKERFTEVPVTFRKRVGPSSFTGRWYMLVKWGILLQLYVISFWINWKVGKVKA